MKNKIYIFLVGNSFINISIGLFSIFYPIFLYQILDKNLLLVAFYYLIDYFFYMIVVALAAKFISQKIGFRRSIVIGVVFGIVSLKKTELGEDLGKINLNKSIG